MNLVFDHYNGFEGEPEIIFKSADCELTVNLWDGYLFAIMNNAVPNIKGRWESLALLYHTHTGWYASSPFELSEVGEALIQLRTLFSSVWHPLVLAAYNDLVSVFEYAEKMQITIVIEYY